MEACDVIVIGGGPIGLATAYQLGKRKAKTLLLEQFTFPNELGSSAGVSRQWRLPYPDAYMVQLVKQSVPYWEELQSLTSATLLDKVGTLWFGDPTVKSTEGNIAAAEKALQQENVPYTTLTAAEIERQYKFTSLQPDYTGLFQADGASINLLATSQTLLRANRDLPTVKMESLTRVNAIAQSGSTFTVSTLNGDSFTTPKLVLVPGPYANGIFNMLGFQIEATYWNMTSAFYRITKPGIQYPTWFVFQPPIGDNGNEFYGFPEVSWNNPGYIRVASDFVIHPLQSVLQRTLIPNRQELEYTAAWVRNHMTGLDPAWQFASTCLVALSDIRNKELLIDFAPPYVPNNKNIVIYATGWAAKFVPLLGVILSQLALDGRTPFDISNFALGNVFFKSLESQGES